MSAQLSSEFHYVEKIFFQLDARNEDKTEDNLIFSEDLAEDCQSRGEMSNRYKNLEKIISEFQKEDNINNLTKQTLFDHLNNVAMSSNNNTQSARVNAGCNNIENQLELLHEAIRDTYFCKERRIRWLWGSVRPPDDTGRLLGIQ